MRGILQWIDDHFLAIITAVLIGVTIGVAVVVIGAIFVPYTAPLNTDVPMPLDICHGAQSNVVLQDSVATVDYINRRGDTVYLVYGISSIDPYLRSKQVIDGDDCKE